MTDTPVCRRCNGDGEVAEDGRVWECGACEGAGYTYSTEDEREDTLDDLYREPPERELPEEEYDWEGDAR